MLLLYTILIMIQFQLLCDNLVCSLTSAAEEDRFNVLIDLTLQSTVSALDEAGDSITVSRITIHFLTLKWTVVLSGISMNVVCYCAHT